MEKARFLQVSILLIIPFHNRQKSIAFVISTCAPEDRSTLWRITGNLAGATILIALAKTIYNGKRRNLTPVDFETLRRAA